jgi:RNA-directed DNA polymerase
MDPANLLTKRHWIVELARRKPGGVLYSLNHVIDFEWMREAYLRTRKDRATGIDGMTAADYEANLEANLRDLLERIKSGRYHAPPVRRTYIPKADGSQRPLGIPTFEDKIAQRAVWCWRRSTSRTSCPARTASGPDDRRTRRCVNCSASSRGKGSTG